MTQTMEYFHRAQKYWLEDGMCESDRLQNDHTNYYSV